MRRRAAGGKASRHDHARRRAAGLRRRGAGLVGAQFPDWRGLPVSRVDSPGTVNAIFRTGDKLAALSQVGLEMFERLVYRDLHRPDIVGGVGK